MRLLRLLIAFALALTVPFQGLAAASAALCDDQAPQADVAAQDGHDHDAGAPHQHGKPGGDNHGESHCPPCSASAAIAGFSPVFLPEAASVRVVDRLPSLVSCVTPQRLDRPPLAL
jgi:hypothetical protein